MYDVAIGCEGDLEPKIRNSTMYLDRFQLLKYRGSRSLFMYICTALSLAVYRYYLFFSRYVHNDHEFCRTLFFGNSCSVMKVQLFNHDFIDLMTT